jgi:nucleoside-diphosphate-sugar epimerase
VTGGGGFLGRYIVEQLLARGDSVRVLARGDYPELTGLGVEVCRGDVRNPEDVDRACRGSDSVFHAAAVPGIWGRWEHYHGTNTAGTRHVIESCLRQGVARLVYTSSPSVVFDGRPHENADESLPYATEFLCHYPHTKAIAEREVLAANRPGGLATVALRPHLIWGPRDNHLIPRLIRRARSGRLRRVGDGTNLVSVSYVENAAAAHLRAHDALSADSRAAGRAYFINEPEPVRLWGWIDELLRRAGLPPVGRAVSQAAALRIGRACELVYGALGLRSEPPMTRFLALQLSQSHWYSVGAAERDLGYRSDVSMGEALERLTPELERWVRSA